MVNEFQDLAILRAAGVAMPIVFVLWLARDRTPF
jgi:hypothetical protein